MRWGVALLSLLLALWPRAVNAQVTPGPPGPYVIDLRGAMVWLPVATTFYPPLPDGGIVPGRGFGVDVGVHVLGPRVGASRLGVGMNVLLARGQAGQPVVSATVRTIAPQVSFNFGTHDGWSYLGAGYGLTSVATGLAATTTAGLGASMFETGLLPALNAGGGARWFTSPRLATGFDLRFHRIGASRELGTPATFRLALSVGISVR